MTGWRIGWMLVPDRLRRAVDVLTGNFTICPPVLAQRACLAAFDDASYAELDGHVARYADNRRLLLDGLPRLGITELAPADGAFYVYADVGHLTDDTMAFAHDLLARTGVAVAPGIDFDTVDGGRFVRLSFAGPGRRRSRRPSPGSPQPSTADVSPRPPAGMPCPTPTEGDDMYGDTTAIRAWPAACATRPTTSGRRPTGCVGPRRRACPGSGLAADAMRRRTRDRVGRAAADRRPARRRRGRPRPARRRGRPAQGPDRRDRASGCMRWSRRPGTGSPGSVDGIWSARLVDPARRPARPVRATAVGHKDWLTVDLPGLHLPGLDLARAT